MFSKEAQKILALHEVNLARLYGFRSYLIGPTAHGRAQTQHFSWFNQLHDKCLAVTCSQRQLHSSLAQDENAPGILAFDEEHCSLWVGGWELDGVEGLQGGCWKIAEDGF